MSGIPVGDPARPGEQNTPRRETQLGAPGQFDRKKGPRQGARAREASPPCRERWASRAEVRESVHTGAADPLPRAAGKPGRSPRVGAHGHHRHPPLPRAAGKPGRSPRVGARGRHRHPPHPPRAVGKPIPLQIRPSPDRQRQQRPAQHGLQCLQRRNRNSSGDTGLFVGPVRAANPLVAPTPCGRATHRRNGGGAPWSSRASRRSAVA